MGRNCAVVGCSNSHHTIKKWKEGTCVKHSSPNGIYPCTCWPFELHAFPTKRKTEARNEWLRRLNRRGYTITVDSRICSKHFFEGKPTVKYPYPTEHMGYTLKEKDTKSVRPPPQIRTPTVPKKKAKQSITPSSTSSQEQSSHEQSSQSTSSNPLNSKAAQLDHSYCNNESSDTSEPDCELSDQHGNDNECPCHFNCILKIESLSDLVKSLKFEIIKLRYAVKVQQKKTETSGRKPSKDSFERFSHKRLVNDSLVKLYTGLPDLNTWEAMYQLLAANVHNITTWKGPSKTVRVNRKFVSTPKKFGPKRKLPPIDEFLILCMKMRLGLLNAHLADMFNISRSLVSRIIQTWAKYVSGQVAWLIFQPDYDLIKANLPESFQNKDYEDVSTIPDCTEVFTETPKSFEAQSSMWSDYKHHNTAKTLVSITPQGQFNFVSKAWGGRASDKHICQNSSYYDTCLKPGKTALADKGFLIHDDLMVRGSRLVIPPGLRGRAQMTEAECKKTKQIANRRIYVEQAIRRLKTWRILKFEVPIVLLPLLDHFMVIIAAFCNLLPPLPKK